MARKRYKPEEIVAKLRQVDVLVSQGHNFAFDDAIFLALYIIDERADFLGRQQHVANSLRPVGVSFYPCASPLKASGFAANAWCRSRKGRAVAPLWRHLK